MMLARFQDRSSVSATRLTFSYAARLAAFACLVTLISVLLQTSGIHSYTAQSLYDPLKDDVELLNATSYNEAIFNSERATFVECYAHWCGACQRYAQHWKEFAKETKLWHSKVIRVAAINCGDSFNDKTCKEHAVHYYPTLKLYPPHASYDAPNHDEIAVKNDGPEQLVDRVIQFIEQLHNKPASWPDLEPYSSKRLDPLFAYHQDINYGILIFEKADSYVGRKLILDFSSYADRLVIRRVTDTSNPTLFNKFEINTNRLPAIFVVNNLKPVKTHEALTVDMLRKLAEEAKHKTNNDFDDEEENEEDKLDHHDAKGGHVNVRQLYAKMIRLFIKYKHLASTTELSGLKKDAEAGKAHKEQKKKDETDIHLKNMDNRVYMQDLESSLNIMLRSEIGHHSAIDGEALTALKEWMRVLNKYFPGRRQVRNYLRNIYEQISSSDIQELSGEQWKKLVDSEKPQSNLPNVVEWRHCQGSDPKFRGYPCSLWTLFHVLTVAQIEYEKAQAHPFEDHFNINEIIEAIINFVKHFFSCQECSENFLKETKDYQRHLKNPYDAIQYLWKVHNKVNNRLAQDQITEQDPKHPKVQFPSAQQCPKCYLDSVKGKALADHETPWSTNDVLLFLSSFYSKYQIDGIEELNNKLSKRPQANDQGPVLQPEEPLKKEDKIIDAQPVKKRGSLEADEKLLDKLENDWMQVSVQKSSDLKLGFVMVLFVIASFGFLFIYFGFIKRKSKLKKHII